MIGRLLDRSSFAPVVRYVQRLSKLDIIRKAKSSRRFFVLINNMQKSIAMVILLEILYWELNQENGSQNLKNWDKGMNA